MPHCYIFIFKTDKINICNCSLEKSGTPACNGFNKILYIYM